MSIFLRISPLLLLAACASTDTPVTGPGAGCETGRQACMAGCEDEKTLWLFKGEEFDRCAAACEQKQKECVAKGMDDDRFEVIRARPAGRNPEPAAPVEPVEKQGE